MAMFQTQDERKTGARCLRTGFRAQGGNIACWLNSTVNCKQSFFADALQNGNYTPADALKQQSSAQERLHKERQADVNERSKMISKLIKGRDTRESYIRLEVECASSCADSLSAFEQRNEASRTCAEQR